MPAKLDRGALPAAHETTLRGATATEALREHDEVSDHRLGKDALERREAARKAIEAATRAGTSRAELERYGQSAKGMRIDLGVLRPPSGSTSRRRAYEVKTTAFCASHYQVREHTGGLTWADFRAREAVRERGKQAAHIDEGLFRGIQPAPMATALAHLGGVEALVLGGCCELNSTAHGLIVEIGTQLGQLMATDSGNGPSECVALEIHRLRQRVAARIWSSYQDHINARTQYADPSTDTRRQHTRDAIGTLEEEREQAAGGTA